MPRGEKALAAATPASPAPTISTRMQSSSTGSSTTFVEASWEARRAWIRVGAVVRATR
ncbi:hypothetical protein ACFQYP_16845 [Nonomuraea antimicrobica]